jgi:EAL and modified HD-GYP domain-containing signal transduction protein
MEALGLDDLDSSTLYFITYSNQLLNHAVAMHLPASKFVVMIRLSDKHSAKEMKNFTDLHSLGYSLKFSGVNKNNASSKLLRLAKYCDFDRRENDADFKRRTIEQYPDVMFIATGVDTQRKFELSKLQGFSLFQGYFFKQPSVVKKVKEIDHLKFNYMRLLKFTSTEEAIDFNEVSDIISSDVALTYKLLRLLNSAAVGLKTPISSINLAVTYLGETNLKRWIAMLALRGVAEDKPLELVRLSLIRARFGELLCDSIKPARNSKHVFLLGMLSLLDVALEMSREEVFKEFLVAAEIRDSLLTEDGPYSDFVMFYLDHEFARWEGVAEFSRKNKVSNSEINNAYITAVKWYNDMLDTD